MKYPSFQRTVYAYYRKNYRTMSWRENTDPYWILVSEVMLQQTQVSRVVPKFTEFIGRFPTIDALAIAPLSDVMQAWSGLGYNRRAKYLHDAAKDIVLKHASVVPKTREELITLPGIGPNTAGAILAYAYNQPVVFIETNIRSVFIHHFFHNTHDVDDKEILPLIEKTLPKSNIKEWYWALMDYGTHLKSTLPNPSRTSKHHTRQSKFEGSNRQLRGRIIRLLAESPRSLHELEVLLSDSRLQPTLQKLAAESLIKIKNNRVSL